ncbi:MAG TPA: hypothetical protein PLP23_02120 [Panacibacter sp.]|nr:hypothetical protein [Panacibacter sp.]
MIQVKPLHKIGEDARGETHVFDMDRTGQFIVAHRKAGSLSGRHYHKGRSPYKNPETLIIMNGEATINWVNAKGTEKGSVKVYSPSFVYIDAWIWHEVVADTDMVLYELNSLADGNGDTFQLDELND